VNRNEAVLVLKEMFEECTLVHGHYLALMPPNAAGLLSHGYQIHLKIPIDEKTRECMERVAKKYDCALSTLNKNGEDIAIIYRPVK
jgi:hypothetical protein